MNEVSRKPKRNKYSSQFKDQELERASREGVSKAAADLGIAEAMLYSWRAQRHQLICSMSKRGDCYDNAHVNV